MGFLHGDLPAHSVLDDHHYAAESDPHGCASCCNRSHFRLRRAAVRGLTFPAHLGEPGSSFALSGLFRLACISDESLSRPYPFRDGIGDEPIPSRLDQSFCHPDRTGS